MPVCIVVPVFNERCTFHESVRQVMASWFHTELSIVDDALVEDARPAAAALV